MKTNRTYQVRHNYGARKLALIAQTLGSNDVFT